MLRKMDHCLIQMLSSMKIFTDKALNNTLWHRRVTFVNVYVDEQGKVKQIRKFDKKKQADKFHRKAMTYTKLRCYRLVVKPNSYKPVKLI